MTEEKWSKLFEENIFPKQGKRNGHSFQYLETDKEWLAVAKPIEEFLNCKLIACDPGFVFRMSDGSRADLPFNFVVELQDKIIKKNKTCDDYYKRIQEEIRLNEEEEDERRERGEI